QELLGKLTPEEKIDMISGVNGFDVRPIERLDVPKMHMSDGPCGTRNDGPTTAYPAPVGLAASWDVDLAKRFGDSIGRDARARGVNFWLAPGVNICRVPQNGRNFEYLGEDPYLASRIVVPIIQGVQAHGVAATVKHFACNNQETERMTIQMGALDRPQKDESIPLDDPAGDATALQIAREGIVLLKNENHTLPLDRAKIKTIAVVGPNADPAMTGGGGSSYTTPNHP